MTSSVTRSTPWSASQSRMSAQRSNEAGSTSCSATAIALTRRASRAPRPWGRRARRGSRRPAGRARGPTTAPRRRRGPRARGGRPARRPVIRSSAAASASASGGRSRPVRPWASIERGPPSATATTGSPLACASRRTWPNVSVRLAKRKTSALAYARASVVAVEPARGTSRARRGARAARPPPGRRRPAQVQARIALARGEERVGEQVDALLAASGARRRARSRRRAAAPGRAARVEAVERRRRGPSGRCARRRPRARASDASAPGSATGRRRTPVEGGDRQSGTPLEPPGRRCAGPRRRRARCGSCRRAAAPCTRAMTAAATPGRARRARRGRAS